MEVIEEYTECLPEFEVGKKQTTKLINYKVKSESIREY